jgi:molybdopterin-guanine dinucleotide biosynthesis protein B
MIPVVSIVGFSKSGKTTFIKKLIERLTSKGYNVGTIKHDVHGFDIDLPGKDSWHHRQGGAKKVVLSSPKRLAVIMETEGEASVEKLINDFSDDLDLILTEGYKKGPFPKIEIHRNETGKPLACLEDEKLVAIFSNEKIDTKVPLFELNDINKGVEIIEKGFLTSTPPAETLSKKSDQEKNTRQTGSQKLTLTVNDKNIPLKPFIEDFLKGSIKGMLASLKDCQEIEKVEIRIMSDTAEE